MDGVVITHNTSHYTLITEYGINELDQVRSTLIISNVTHDISGTYTCWCEYNQSMIYGNKLFRSSPASVQLKVGPGMCCSNEGDYNLLTIIGSHNQSVPRLLIVLGGVTVFVLILLVITFSSCCYYRWKGKHPSTNLTTDHSGERTHLLNGKMFKILNNWLVNLSSKVKTMFQTMFHLEHMVILNLC